MPGAIHSLENAAPHLLVLGDMLLDVTVTGDVSAEREARGSVQLYAGGSAANCAVGAARAGAAVRFVGRVGDDLAGRLLVAELERAGVTACVRVVPGVPTGSVLVLCDIDGQGGKRMLSEPGASATLDPTDLDPAWFAGLAGLHLTGYSFLRPGPAPAAQAALALARGLSPGLVCSLDPAPGHLIADYGPARFRALLAALRFDVLFPNLEEGCLITRLDDPPAVAVALRALAPVVALTLGPAGCLVAFAGGTQRVPGIADCGIEYEDADTMVVRVPAVSTPVADTTGAGDAFAAGFLAAYLREREPVAAGRAGVQAAAEVVARIGPR
jgi:sugar/nucleoside kinase (ribokinase family)